MLFIIIGFIIGICLTCLILIPQVKQREKLDKEIQQKNEQARKDYQDLCLKTIHYQDAANTAQEKLAKAELDFKNTIEWNSKLKAQSDQECQEYYNKSKENIELKLQAFIDAEEEKYQNAKDNYQQEYFDTMNECVTDLTAIMNSKITDCNKLQNKLNELRAKYNAAVELDKENLKEEDYRNYHRIQLSDIDLKEIEKLREIIPYLRQAEPLNKVIWKVYYEKPTTDMIGRVVGQTAKTGIYKITNIKNNMCYVGQAVKLAGEKLFPATTGGL